MRYAAILAALWAVVAVGCSDSSPHPTDADKATHVIVMLRGESDAGGLAQTYIGSVDIHSGAIVAGISLGARGWPRMQVYDHRRHVYLEYGTYFVDVDLRGGDACAYLPPVPDVENPDYRFRYDGDTITRVTLSRDVLSVYPVDAPPDGLEIMWIYGLFRED